jgi:hypothetical protein
MASVQGGGNFRAIVAELADEVALVRQLQPDEPDPTDDELAALAESFRLGASGFRDSEMANGGLPVTCRVVAYAWAGPFAYNLTDEQRRALAGLR